MLWPFLLENDDGLSLAGLYAGRGLHSRFWTSALFRSRDINKESLIGATISK